MIDVSILLNSLNISTLASCTLLTSQPREWGPQAEKMRSAPPRFPWAVVFTVLRTSQPWAFESREFLRALTVGKEVSFTSIHSLPSNDDVPRDLGNADIGGVDLTTELLKNGWAKTKDLKRDPTEEDQKRKELETEAKNAGKGLWNPHGPQVTTFLPRNHVTDR